MRRRFSSGHDGMGISLGQAQPMAREIASLLMERGVVERCEIAGSIRRGRDLVRRIDLVASATSSANALNAFCSLPSMKRVLLRDSAFATVELETGLSATLHISKGSEFAAALWYWTGSKAHNERLSRECGPVQQEAIDERDIYRDLGFQYIPPELREDRGELEAAKAGKLPNLVERREIRGDLHVHALGDGGEDGLEEFAVAASELGYEYLAITEHVRSPFIPFGLNEEGIRRRIREIEHLNRRLEGLTLLAGAEANILKDGSVDITGALARELDLVIGSIHSDFRAPLEETTSRLLKAVEGGRIQVLGHPTSRIIGRRPPAEMDLQRVAGAAAAHGVVLEANAHPARLDLNGELCRRAGMAGALISLGTDAHNPCALNNIEYGLLQARRGWLESKGLVNTLPLSALLRRLER